MWDQLLQGEMGCEGITCFVPAQEKTFPFPWADVSLCQLWRGRVDSSVCEVKQSFLSLGLYSLSLKHVFLSARAGPWATHHFLPLVPDAAVMERLGAVPLQESDCLLHGAPYAKQCSTSAGLKVGGPQLNHRRET